MSRKLIGLSFSLCIQCILRGRVDQDDVKTIITFVDCSSSDDWTYLIGDYKKRYWHENPELAGEIAWKFIYEKRVILPRRGDSLGEYKIPYPQREDLMAGKCFCFVDAETFAYVEL